MGYHIGLDFGTTNSIVSYWQDGKLEAFQYGGENGQKYVPSFIAYDDEFIEIGKSARTTATNHPEVPSYGNFKMDLPLDDQFGNRYDSAKTPQSVTTDYLRELLLSTENSYSFQAQQGPIAGLVVSVPEIWQRDISNRGRERLQTLIAQHLGLEEQLIQLVSEPVAAAAYYAWESQQRQQETQDPPFEGNVLVCDMGGGTFDVSLCRVYGENKVEVLYFDGQGDRGLDAAGVAFDRRCVRLAYQQKHGSSPDENSTEFLHLLQQFEAVKISGHDKYSKKIKNYLKSPQDLAEQILYSFNGYRLNHKQVQEAFQPIAEGIQRVMERVTTWLKENNTTCDRLFLVGGFSQFLLVRNTILDSLGNHLNREQIERQFNLIESAFAISYGACLIANGLVQPSETYIHSLGITVQWVDGETIKISEKDIPLVQGGTYLDDLISVKFADIPPLASFQVNEPLQLTLWVDPKSRGTPLKLELKDTVKLPQASSEDKWRVGMRVNRSHIAYLVVESVCGRKRGEYELGNIIAQLFPSFVLFE
ncbi:Hsp70 family protein [Sodalinema gerasimenkoae]|uniref:Hsp70 family protein n=1 Tax=Sodalinema gerasimenkoae TaxID=2862348 RepID=UPI001357C5C5|nr:Hsp70 family protein [Sodalinema gerasimenkoae]